MPPRLPDFILDDIRNSLGTPSAAVLRAVGGGSVHDAILLAAGSAQWFVKIAGEPAAVRSLRDEADGLQTLAAVPGVRVPEVRALGEAEGWAWLVLPWIAPGRPAQAGAEAGAHVARLHAATRSTWGYSRANAIATLTQDNPTLADGHAFWANARLRGPAESARREGRLSPRELEPILELADAIATRDCPAQRSPVQLHGDLWSGNLHIDEAGRSWLIDPAVYAGDPRIDLAMARLFGGFSAAFFDTWTDVHGCDPGDPFWQHAYTVWPLIVHARLFGASYGAQAGREATHALRLR